MVGNLVSGSIDVAIPVHVRNRGHPVGIGCDLERRGGFGPSEESAIVSGWASDRTPLGLSRWRPE
jgi:hypothetical protein